MWFRSDGRAATLVPLCRPPAAHFAQRISRGKKRETKKKPRGAPPIPETRGAAVVAPSPSPPRPRGRILSIYRSPVLRRTQDVCSWRPGSPAVCNGSVVLDLAVRGMLMAICMLCLDPAERCCVGLLILRDGPETRGVQAGRASAGCRGRALGSELAECGVHAFKEEACWC